MRSQHCSILCTIIVAVALACIFTHSSACGSSQPPRRLGQTRPTCRNGS